MAPVMGAKTSLRLEAIRELLRSLIAAGETDKAIDQAMQIITQQAQRLDQLLRERYGVKSEKASPEQLRLALAELARESGEEPPPASPAPPSARASACARRVAAPSGRSARSGARLWTTCRRAWSCMSISARSGHVAAATARS